MTSPPSEPAPLSYFRFGAADLLFVAFAGAILLLASVGMADDPGLGWQLRIPDAMFEQGGFVFTDPFGGPTQGQPWTPYGFLGSAAFRLAEEWAGLRGIVTLAALLLALVLRCVYVWLRADDVPPAQALAWTVLAALGISTSWVARPNLFTLLLLPVVARVVVQWHRGQITKGRTLWLLPLFLAWANTHGGFAAGLVTIATAAAVELALACFGPVEGREAATGRFRWLALLGAGCAAATLVNPYGPRLHLTVLQMTSDPFMMNLNDDWLSPDFHARGAFRLELFILLLPALLAASRQRPDWVSLALALLWLHQALNGRRYGPLWVLITVPLLARLAKDTLLLERFEAWLNRTAPALAARTAAPRSGWAWTAVLGVGLLAASRFAPVPVGHNPEIIPARALDRLLEEYQGEKTFHSINWGGYLTWHGWLRQPRFLVWIDDRNEIYGRERTEEWLAITTAQPGWRDKLDQYDIRLVCVEKNSALAQRLQEEPDARRWEKIHGDDYATIFRRRE